MSNEKSEERDQWKQGHNDAVRVGLEYQRQLTIATGDLEAMTVEANMLLTENRKLEQQLAEMTQAWRDGQAEISRLSVFHEDDEPSWRHRAEALTQQLAKVTAERDAYELKYDLIRNDQDYQQCCELRRLAYERLADMTAERDEAVRIAKMLMEPSPVTEADVKWAQDMLAAKKHQEGLS